MHEWLRKMLQQPTVGVEGMGGTTGQPLCFLIDQIRQPDVLTRLYSLSEIPKIELLLQGTEFSSLQDHGPIWIVTYARSAAASLAARICSDRRSGIALETMNTDAALQQARHLLKVADPERGFSLARYYDPAFWAAWALTWPDAALYGPWSRVYTPPATAAAGSWRVWPAPNEIPGATAQTPKVTSETLEAFKLARWWYWINSQTQGSPISDTALPLVIDNLQLLTKHGIEEGRHLQRLLPMLGNARWNESSEVMELLRANMPPYKKVQILEA